MNKNIKHWGMANLDNPQQIIEETQKAVLLSLIDLFETIRAKGDPIMSCEQVKDVLRQFMKLKPEIHFQNEEM